MKLRTEIEERCGSDALDCLEGRTPARRRFTKAERGIQRELFEASTKIARLIERRDFPPGRVAELNGIFSKMPKESIMIITLVNPRLCRGTQRV
jgi:hypothetical protein